MVGDKSRGNSIVRNQQLNAIGDGQTCKELLVQLDRRGVPYVSWKDNHELDEALCSGGELDLFVPIHYRALFVLSCRELNWIRVENPVARYPDVEHWYCASPEHGVFHVHVYYRVVTGESWLKEYLLPLDDFLVTNRVRSPEHDIWILSKEAQAKLFAIRHLLKGGSIVSRMLYRRSLATFEAEWQEVRPEAPGLVRVLELPVGPETAARMAGLSGDRLKLPKFLEAVRFRYSIFPFLRFAPWTLTPRRLASFTVRALNRLVLKQRKLAIDGGIVIAVCGTDGAGKTTTLDAAVSFYSEFLTVRRVHLGRPQGPILERMRRVLRTLQAKKSSKGAHATRELSDVRPETSSVSALAAVSVAMLRLRASHRARRLANRGIIVFSDRWPSMTPGKVDGPRLSPTTQNGRLYSLCQRIEQWAYGHMARADVCFWFEVPLATAIQRNEARDKGEKETAQEIQMRYQASIGVRPIADEVITFRNEDAFELTRARFLKSVWGVIASRSG